MSSTPIVSRNAVLQRIEKQQHAAIEAAVAKVNEIVNEATALPVFIPIKVFGDNMVVRNAVLERIKMATYRVEDKYVKSGAGEEDFVGYTIQ